MRPRRRDRNRAAAGLNSNGPGSNWGRAKWPGEIRRWLQDFASAGNSQHQGRSGAGHPWALRRQPFRAEEQPRRNPCDRARLEPGPGVERPGLLSAPAFLLAFDLGRRIAEALFVSLAVRT